MFFAVIKKSARISDPAVAYATKAIDLQAQECAAAYGMPAIPVVFYATTDGLPTRDCIFVLLVDELDVDGALGYHTDDGGMAYARVLVQEDVDGTTTTDSHEVLEALVDMTCDQYRPMPDGNSVALEVCDPVEADAYPITVTIDGDARPVWVSNYVLPRWFDPAASFETGPFDRMQILRAPFAMSDGGYMIVRDRLGNETQVLARDADAKATAARKRARPDSRVARRLAA